MSNNRYFLKLFIIQSHPLTVYPLGTCFKHWKIVLKSFYSTYFLSQIFAHCTYGHYCHCFSVRICVSKKKQVVLYNIDEEKMSLIR